MDLVAGGYRDGINGMAYFPVTDAQGNVRGYASDEGLQSAYDYYAYGGVEKIAVNETDDKKRWQGKEYDGEHGKYYFDARYFDPFFGMWMSPDPASQFANPYTYGGDPLNYVDPNGEWVHIVVGAVIGGVVGTVNGVIQCTSAGGGSCGKSIGVGFVGGAAVGAGAAATGGLAAEAVGGGFAGAVAGGAAGGAVGGAGNYVNQSIVNGGFNSGDLGESTWKGAAAGAVGGGAGAFAGNYMAQGYASMVGGFAGGASGSAFNGGDGWDILKGGLMGAGMAYVSTVVDAGIESQKGFLDEEIVNSSNMDNDARNELVTPKKASVEMKKMFDDFSSSDSDQGLLDLMNGTKTEVSRVYNEDGSYVSGSDRRSEIIRKSDGKLYKHVSNRGLAERFNAFKIYVKSSFGFSFSRIHTHLNSWKPAVGQSSDITTFNLDMKNGITNYIYLRNSSTNSFYRYVGENGAKAQMAPILY
ncbi:MAG TPA: RHS repeat-associated core domain-containing protein [Sedimentibacter sp.]|nr:RHS repeat-associated core domain-containing protein [Sedimentibacter sp.]